MDPNQLASQKPADLDLHCFSKYNTGESRKFKVIERFYFKFSVVQIAR